MDLKNLRVGIPPQLSSRAQTLSVELESLLQEAKNIQATCQHDWQKVTWKDPEYSPRLDDIGKGSFIVIKEFHCPKCQSTEPIKGFPFTVCRLCGGNMKFDRREQFGMDTAHIRKCESCGHEYDTT